MVVLLVLFMNWASAAELGLDEVLGAVDARMPQLIAAEAKIAQARAKEMEARGAFDPKFTAKGSSEIEGYYERELLNTYFSGLTQAGVEYTLGYERGVGDFPPYYGEYETLDDGELYAIIAVPLLRGLGINEDRAKLLAAEAKIDMATADFDDKRRMLLFKAAVLYLKWVKAGRALDVAEQQLGLAEIRVTGLERRVQTGDAPRIDLLDNQRVLFERRGAVRAATQDVQVAALELSLLYRDQNGEPIVPTAAQLPESFSLQAPPFRDVEADVGEAWANRPDLQAIDSLLDQAEIELRVARNQLLPELNAFSEVSQDFGEGEDNFAPFELDAGIELKIPLLARKARGRTGAAQADITRLEAERVLLKDSVRAQLQARWTDVQAAWERRVFAEEALSAANEVAELERRNFELGGGDLFRVNKREEDVAKAAKAAIEARYAYLAARAAYAAALNQALELP